MATTTTKKPVINRVPAASKGAAVKAARKSVARIAVKAEAKTAPAPVSKITDKMATKPVEWPVDAPEVATAKTAKRIAKKPAEVTVPQKMTLVPAPIAPAPAAALVEPAVAAPVAPVVKSIPVPAPAVANASAAAAKKGKFIMTDAIETAKTYAEEAKTRIQSAVAEMNEKAKVAMEKSSKAMEELGELTKGNFDAVVESSKIAAKGMEALSQDAVEFGRKSFEKSSLTFKSFASVKSPAEFFQLQSDLLSTTMDSIASEASKGSETMMKLVGEISQPISNRVAIVSERVKALAA